MGAVGMSAVDPSDAYAGRAIRFAPPLAIDWLRSDPTRRHHQLEGSMLYVDVDGFTRLSERLVAHGRVGAEELVTVLGRVVESVVDTAAQRNGQLVEFAGDSMLLFFTGDDHAAQACASAVEIQGVLRRLSAERTAVGRVVLRVSAGVHSAAFDFFLVGNAPRQLVCLGNEFDTVVALENAAAAGQILVSEPTVAHLPPGSTRLDPLTDRHALRWRSTTRVEAPTNHERPVRQASWESEARLLSDAFVGAVCRDVPEPSHRVATIVFAEVMHTTRHLRRLGVAAFTDALDETVMMIHDTFAAEQLCVLSVDVCSDATRVFASSGAPTASEDDEGRALRAGLAVLDADAPLDVRVGVNRGHVFAAEIAAEERSVYSAMGDTTNTAARICSVADPGQLLAHPDVLANARRQYEAVPAGPFTLKGKAGQQPLYAVHRESTALNRSARDELPCTGRDTEIAQLAGLITDAVTSTERDDTRLVDGDASSDDGGPPETADAALHGIVLVGEAGVGKSRVLTEAMSILDGHRQLVLVSEPSDQADPYAALSTAIRSLLQLDAADHADSVRRLRSCLGAHLAAAEPFWPLLGDIVRIELPTTVEVDALASENRLRRTADLLVELLDSASSDPLVIIVEDGQWVDAGSAAVIRLLTDAGVRRPWATVVTRRIDASAGAAAASGAVGLDFPDGVRIHLEPLDQAASTELVRAATEAMPLHRAQLQQIARHGAGNPLFLGELLGAARQPGSPASTSATLLRTIVAQLDHVDPPTRRALESASVLGATFRREDFDALLDRQGFVIDESTRQQVGDFLRTDDVGTWAFRHGVVRDAVHDSMSYRRRRQLHAAAASMLETLTGRGDVTAALLAYQFGEAGDVDKTFEYALVAADDAERTHAPVEAAQQLRAAIHSSARSDRLDRRGIRSLHLRLAAALDRSALFEDAVAALSRAGALSETPADRAEVELLRARVRERSGHFPAALAANTRAVRCVMGEPAVAVLSVRARARAHSAIVYQVQGRPAPALDAARQAMADAEASGERQALAQACSLMARAALMAGDGEAVGLSRRSLELFEEIGDLVGQSRVSNNLGIEAYYRGDWVEAVRRYERCAEIADRTGAVTDAAITRLNIGELLVNQGLSSDAEPILRRCRQDLRAAEHWAAALADGHLGRVRMLDGDLTDAAALIRAGVAGCVEIGNLGGAYELTLSLGACLALLGQPRAAVDAVDAAAEGIDARQTAVHTGIRCLIEAAAQLRLGDSEQAAAAAMDGIRFARENSIDYDLAQLLEFTTRHDLSSDPLADASEADAIFARLGVVAVPPL